MQWIHITALIIVCSWVSCISATAENTTTISQPNVIILFIDDLGMGDLGKRLSVSAGPVQKPDVAAV